MQYIADAVVVVVVVAAEAPRDTGKEGPAIW